MEGEGNGRGREGEREGEGVTIRVDDVTQDESASEVTFNKSPKMCFREAFRLCCQQVHVYIQVL